jgi:hypothetical protein
MKKKIFTFSTFEWLQDLWPIMDDIRDAIPAVLEKGTTGVFVVSIQGPMGSEGWNEKVMAEIRGAVARGWCSNKNREKVIDSDLAEAISQEILLLMSQPENQEEIV